MLGDFLRLYIWNLGTTRNLHSSIPRCRLYAASCLGRYPSAVRLSVSSPYLAARLAAIPSRCRPVRRPAFRQAERGGFRFLVPLSRSVGRGVRGGGAIRGKRLGWLVRPFRAVFGSSFFHLSSFPLRLSWELLGSHFDCLCDVAAIIVWVASTGDALLLNPSVVGFD